ncbi:MAG: hypothetical protein IPG68_15375 [Micrococcales bacterium]|nr:hypothetical protein [Micrococcales bacterium]
MYERVFGTPVGVDVRALLAAHGVTVHDAEDLVGAIAAAAAAPGLNAVVVVPVSRDAEAKLHQRLQQVLA